MRLRNKKTGEIIETCEIFENLCGKIRIRKNGIESYAYEYDSLAELAEEWEDYKKTDKYWFINPEGEVTSMHEEYEDEEDTKATKEIGNYFETKEEAELAARKLKAWKRLKDKGFRFCGHDDRDRGQLGDIVIYAEMPTFEYDDDSTRDDLDLLFGGEE